MFNLGEGSTITSVLQLTKYSLRTVVLKPGCPFECSGVPVGGQLSGRPSTGPARLRADPPQGFLAPSQGILTCGRGYEPPFARFTMLWGTELRTCSFHVSLGR